jgi:predicted DNA-binding transcriptional regulator AlpA
MDTNDLNRDAPPRSPEIRTIGVAKVGDKFGRGRAWVYGQNQNNPDFPRGFRIAGGDLVWLEHEIDAYILSEAARSRTEAARLEDLRRMKKQTEPANLALAAKRARRRTTEPA